MKSQQTPTQQKEAEFLIQNGYLKEEYQKLNPTLNQVENQLRQPFEQLVFKSETQIQLPQMLSQHKDQIALGDDRISKSLYSQLPDSSLIQNPMFSSLYCYGLPMNFINYSDTNQEMLKLQAIQSQVLRQLICQNQELLERSQAYMRLNNLQEQNLISHNNQLNPGERNSSQLVKIKKKISKDPIQSYSIGHWSTQEHEKYIEFLDNYKQVMTCPEQKKANKIFKLMSDEIGTRSPSQCRSHHQKFNPFLKKTKDIRKDTQSYNLEKKGTMDCEQKPQNQQED